MCARDFCVWAFVFVHKLAANLLSPVQRRCQVSVMIEIHMHKKETATSDNMRALEQVLSFRCVICRQGSVCV